MPCGEAPGKGPGKAVKELLTRKLPILLLVLTRPVIGFLPQAPTMTVVILGSCCHNYVCEREWWVCVCVCVLHL